MPLHGPPAPCSHCARPLSNGQGRPRLLPGYCSAPDCRRARDRERMRVFNERWMAEHGEAYSARYADKRATSLKEWKARTSYKSRESSPAAARAGDALRRARKRGVDAERFDPVDIFERDGWQCGICEELVDKALAYPHPLSASLDHVIPLSLEGPHTRANARCAHLSCNVRRGNRAA